MLRSPALISACGEATCTVRDAGGALSLQSYMRLPVEQYYILDPSQIRFLESNVFQLAVPPINLLGTSLQPRLRVAVATREDAVVLEATGCQLRGSGALGALDDKFSMTFTTTITWSNGEGAAGEAGDGDAEEGTADSSGAEGGGAWRSLRGGLQQWGIGGGGGDSGDRGARGSLTGSADIQVFCEVIPPFHLMPREALEVSCNAVLRGLVRSLLPMFMRQLAADYRRWASDESYRLERASRGRPLSEAMT